MSGITLIVDDSPILRRSMRRALNQAGVPDDAILEAGNGQEALERIQAESVQLVLLDLNMPIMNGEEFLEALAKECQRTLPRVIVVTTEANAARLAKLSSLGAAGYLHKPFEPEQLRQLAGSCLGIDP